MIEKEKIGKGSVGDAITGSTMSRRSQCSRCCMDVSAMEITFDKKGVCNFCHQAQAALKSIGEMPEIPPGRDYDVLIGLSGGVDSSYTLWQAKKLGFRVLAFSIDNGYNKPEADENIMRLVEGLKIPFFRYVIDLKKFTQLQSAFMKAGVPNIEIPTDHILMAASFEIAAKYGIKTILSGGNVATESIMPPSWGYSARDLKHIKSIYRRETGRGLTGLPLCSLFMWNVYRWWYGIRTVYLLDYVEYNREVAEKALIQEFGFKSTGEKHEENYFTWWFQTFYLFEKFGFDKRKPHYSSMINSGQMTRQEALDKLTAAPIYPRLGIEARVLGYPKHAHEDYPMDKWYPRIAKLIKLIT